MTKTTVLIALAALVSGAAGVAAYASAQSGDAEKNGGPYEIVLSTTEASGGVSTGGDYELRSVVGQPIAELSNPSTGGDYELRSGFLAGAAVPQEPSAFIVY